MAKIANGTSRKVSAVSVKQGAAKMGEFMQKKVSSTVKHKEQTNKGAKRN